MKKFKKKPQFIILFLVTILLGFSLFFALNKKLNTWRTFTSQNFSFMYPSTWSYTPAAPVNGLTNTDYQNLTFKGEGKENVNVQWDKNLSGASGYCEGFKSYGRQVSNYSIEKLGLNGCVSNDSANGTVYVLSRTLKNGDTILIFAGPLTSPNDPKDLINQILSTFKFQ